MTYRYHELYDPFYMKYDWELISEGDEVSVPLKQDTIVDFVREGRYRAKQLGCIVLFQDISGFFGVYMKATFQSRTAHCAPVQAIPMAVSF